MQNSKILLAVQSPVSLLASYLAATHLKQSSFNAVAVEVLAFDIANSSQESQKVLSVLEDISNILGITRIVFLDKEQSIKIHRSLCWRTKIKLVEERLAGLDFEHVFILRNHSNNTSELLAKLFDSSVLVEYGDSFGIIGEEAWMSTMDQPRTALGRFKKILNKASTVLEPPVNTPLRSILTLPVDVSGSGNFGKTVNFADIETAKELLIFVGQRLMGLQQYQKEVITEAGKDFCVFLLSNLSASGYCSIESEIELYEMAITRAAPRGTIILKTHPRASMHVVDRLSDRLSNRYRVHILKSEYLKYPVELWGDFLSKGTVYPLFSTTAISLSFLTSVNVRLVLTDGMLNKAFSGKNAEHLIAIEQINRHVLARKWDQTSFLY